VGLSEESAWEAQNPKKAWGPVRCVKDMPLGKPLFEWDETVEAQALRLKCKNGKVSWESLSDHSKGRKL
jgi:hypothetical protein